MTVRFPIITLLPILGAIAFVAPVAALNTIKKVDTDHDGKISSAEHAAFSKEMFHRMDSDNDGKVTTAEWDAGHARLDVRANKATGGQHEAFSPAGHGMSGADMMKTLDTNHDGALTEDEYASWTAGRFANADADHDGYVTAAELKAAHEMREEMDADMAKTK